MTLDQVAKLAGYPPKLNTEPFPITISDMQNIIMTLQAQERRLSRVEKLIDRIREFVPEVES